MKQLINNYTFSKTAKTVTFTDYTSIELKRVLLVTNTTRNTIIYNFADSTKGGTVATNVLTLTYDTTSMSNTDKLQIFYDLDRSTDAQKIHSIDSFDEVDRFLSSYDIQYVFKDDFSKGFQGWQYQYDSTGRTGITLTEEARKGNYALELHSRHAAFDEAWCRKGLRVPENVKKIVYGGYFTFHAINVNNPLSVNFELDYQTAAGTNRRYYSLRYLNHDGTTLLTKWQMATGVSTLEVWTDVSGGTMTIPWNEQMKPMLNYIVVILDIENARYDTLYTNGSTFDLTSYAPTAESSLTNFNEGAVSLYRVVNRGNSSEEGILTLEKTFLGYIY